ncbi:MAG: serine/threonine protein kinase [Planctomycetaceae bacterium]
MANFDDTQIQGDDEREGSRRLSMEDKAPPAEIEGYSVMRRLGTGAYGTVWLAREDHTGRMVAIKYYPHRRGLNWSLLNREVEKLATLYASRNIVRLLDVGWNAEPPYYVMEFVENGSLGAYLAGGPVGVDEAIRICRQVCDALVEAHGAGVLHCDLKPDNVLLDAQFHVRLCDFGQSRMSHEQSPALGTLYYMAPEQADLNAVPDARWDVYAVGALLYHMLTGQPPYREPEIQRQLESTGSLLERLELYQQIIRNAPPPSLHQKVRGVDNRLAGLVDRCLAVDPAMRLPNAQAIIDELDARERHRARRPLLLLGVLGPILLMAAMVPIFVNALQNNLETMARKLVERALESDALSAGIQARGLQDQLELRLDELDAIANDDEFVGTLESLMQRPSEEIAAEMTRLHLAAPADLPDWLRELDEAHDRADAANRHRDRSLDTSWFLTDARGTQIWRRPYSPKTIGGNFSYRDYFHGRNLEYEEGNVPDDVLPIQSPHVSIAFRSEATNRYMVALSVPVRSSSGEVIGIFARTAHLGDLQDHLGKQIQGTRTEADTVNRIIALADVRTGRLLDHPWLTPEVLKRSEEEAKKLFSRLQMRDSDIDAARAEIAKRAGFPPETDESEDGSVDAAAGNPRSTPYVTLPDYQDPVGALDEPAAGDFRGPWMAAMAAMEIETTPWLVIVQENRDAALLPVREMAARATRQAWLAVAASFAMMAAVWVFVWRALSREKPGVPLKRPPEIDS